jgi:hypothetical protein
VGEVRLNGFSDESKDAPRLLPAGFDDGQWLISQFEQNQTPPGSPDENCCA